MGLPGSTLDHQGVMNFFAEGYFELFVVQVMPKIADCLPQNLALMRTRPLHCWEHIRLVRLAKKQKKGNLGFVAWSGM